MSSSGKHKSAMMSAEVIPGSSVEVEKAIADEDANVAIPSKKIKVEKVEKNEKANVDIPAKKIKVEKVEKNEKADVAIPSKKNKVEKVEKVEKIEQDQPNSDTPEGVNSYMTRTFDVRRSYITVELPTINEVKESYPELFIDRQIMLEFERITDIDLDHALQEYCVSHWRDITDMCLKISSAKDLLKQAEGVKKDNPSLEQYWDMVASLCLVPYMMKENLCDMVIEIGEDEKVDPKGKIVPVLVSKGNVFKSDEFILVVEEEVVQEFEEFTIAFASLFATYWIFNMEYPDTLVFTYNFIQKVMVGLKDGTPLPTPCREIQQKLIKMAKARTKDKHK